MRSWSVSSIRQFHQCQLAWHFKRTGVPEEFKALALAEGASIHEVLAHHLRGMMNGSTPSEEECLEVLEGAFFTIEVEGEVKYGSKGREDVLERLRALYRHWRANLKVEGTIAAVEEEVRAQFQGIAHPMLGYIDLVIDKGNSLEVVDHKVSASRRAWDDLLDPFDIQKVAYTRAIELSGWKPVSKWRWSVLTKTKEPRVIEDALDVRSDDREPELTRLTAIVAPTVRLMKAVEEGTLQPVPTQSYAKFCQGCAFRMACAQWGGSGTSCSKAGAMQPSGASA